MINDYLTDYALMPDLYGLVALDCPWTYQSFSETGQGRSAGNEYPTMTLVELTKLGPLVTRLLDPAGAFVLAWVTGPGLIEQTAMFAEWGLKYITIAFSWVKKSKAGKTYHVGTGHFTASNVELCLLYGYGNYKKPPESTFIPQLIVSPESEGQELSLWNVLEDAGNEQLMSPVVANVTSHSAKPIQFYRRAEMLHNHMNANRLELFARHRMPGWWATGLDLDGLDIRDALPMIANRRYQPLYDRLSAPAVTRKRGKGRTISENQLTLFGEYDEHSDS